MKVILKEEYLAIPDDITVTIKARKVVVKGPKGEVSQDLSHVQCDITRVTMNTKKMTGDYVRVAIWNGAYRRICSVKTVLGLINNMFVGVTEGFRYRMKLVYAHFPISAVISKDGSQVEIKNFLGGKKTHLIKLAKDCKVFLNKDAKDELVFDGIDKHALSQSCARVTQVCNIGNKDERKFLDGIFVSQKTLTNPKD